jgi:hypothetical protein
LDDRDRAVFSLEDLHPTVVAHDTIGADDCGPAGSHSNAGFLWGKVDDLVVLVLAEAVPGAAQRRVDRKERIAVGPQMADVQPSLTH